MNRDRKPRQSRGPEFLVDLAEQITQVLTTDIKLSHETAELAAWEIAEHMAFHWGGQNIYFPQGVSLRISRRNEAIWAAFDGTNVSELAQQYSVSEQCIYNVIRVMRKVDTARRQGQLFGKLMSTSGCPSLPDQPSKRKQSPHIAGFSVFILSKGFALSVSLRSPECHYISQLS